MRSGLYLSQTEDCGVFMGYNVPYCVTIPLPQSVYHHFPLLLVILPLMRNKEVKYENTACTVTTLTELSYTAGISGPICDNL
jgi:hypothetical protein